MANVMLMGMLRCATKLNPVHRSLIVTTISAAINMAMSAAAKFASKNLQHQPNCGAEGSLLVALALLNSTSIAKALLDTDHVMQLIGVVTCDGRALDHAAGRPGFQPAGPRGAREVLEN